MQLTNQTFFDMAWKRSIEMTDWAIDEGGSCSYRGPNGPCLIGAAIPEEEYSPKIEGSDVRRLAQEGMLPDCLSAVSVHLLDEVQGAHDGIVRDWVSGKIAPFDRSKLLNNLRMVAMTFNLQVPGE